MGYMLRKDQYIQIGKNVRKDKRAMGQSSNSLDWDKSLSDDALHHHSLSRAAEKFYARVQQGWSAKDIIN
jgi:hypothetical protein